MSHLSDDSRRMIRVRSALPGIRPTNRGWWALLFGALALVGAQLSGTAQFYQLAYAMFALLFCALALALVAGRGLTVERRISSGVRPTAGRSACVEVVVRNGSFFASSPATLIDRLPLHTTLALPSIAGKSTYTLTTTVLFERRGLYKPGPCEIYAADPFGLVRIARRMSCTDGGDEVLVYPELYGLPELLLPDRQAEGAVEPVRKAKGDGEFSGIREYRKGDDRRHIHWKAVARTGNLLVREYDEAPRGPSPRYTVAVDLRSGGPGCPASGVEEAVSAAGSALERILIENRLAGRLVCGGQPGERHSGERHSGERRSGSDTSFGTGETHFWKAMELLAIAEPENAYAFEDALLATEREELGQGVILVSAACGADTGIWRAVEGLLASGLAVTVVAIADHTCRAPGADGPVNYGTGPANGPGSCEAAFTGEVTNLERAGAAVRIVQSTARPVQ